MAENVGRVIGVDADGRPFELHDVAHLEIHVDAEAVRNGARTSATQAEERGFDSRPPLQLHDFAAAGRHGNHRRWNRPDPACVRCVAEGLHRPDIAPISPPDRPPIAPIAEAADSRSDRPDRPDIAPMHRSNDDDRTSFVVDSPSDLPLSYAVLLRKFSRGGQRTGHVSPRAVRRIRAVIACPDVGHDDRWCAAILDDARGDALRTLEGSHAAFHAPAPPDPVEQAEADEGERRRQAYALRQQLDAGVDELGRPLGEVARVAAERQLRRLEALRQAQGP